MYAIAGGRLNLKITDGEISLASLQPPGFGTKALETGRKTPLPPCTQA